MTSPPRNLGPPNSQQEFMSPTVAPNSPGPVAANGERSRDAPHALCRVARVADPGAPIGEGEVVQGSRLGLLEVDARPMLRAIGGLLVGLAVVGEARHGRRRRPSEYAAGPGRAAPVDVDGYIAKFARTALKDPDSVRIRGVTRPTYMVLDDIPLRKVELPLDLLLRHERTTRSRHCITRPFHYAEPHRELG